MKETVIRVFFLERIKPMSGYDAMLFCTVVLLAVIFQGCSKSSESDELPVTIEAPAEVNKFVTEFVKENPVITDPTTQTKYSIRIVKPSTAVEYSIIQVKPDPTKGYSIIVTPGPGGRAYDTAEEALAEAIRKNVVEKLQRQKPPSTHSTN
jgi:hypothetical protein